MPTTTPNYGLHIYNTTTDKNEAFENFRDLLAGVGTNSNMYIIDSKLKEWRDDINSLEGRQSVIRVPITKDGANHYSASGVVGVSNPYEIGMILVLVPDVTNDGTTALNINSTGDVSLVKIGSTGSPVNLSAGELVGGASYLFIYDGTNMIWISPTVLSSIIGTGTTNGIIRLNSSGALENSGETTNTDNTLGGGSSSDLKIPTQLAVKTYIDNRISQSEADDLLDGGDSLAHYHSADRSRTNHTGTQTASTISDFYSTVRSTVLTGLSTATNALISATDTVLEAFGKIQAQISGLSSVYAAIIHTHAATDVTSGTLSNDRLDIDLKTIGNLTPADNDIIQRKSGAWSNRTPSQVATDIQSQIDHGALLGLGDDDHTQYFNNTRGDVRYLRKYAGVLNVKDYGAVGDGSTNDTTSIQNAVNAASSYQVVYFPPGTYLVNSISLKPGVAMIGSGNSASVIKANSNSTSLFGYSASSTQSDFEIRGFLFDSNSRTGCWAINLDGTDSTKRIANVRISEVTIYGTFDRGVNLKYAANTFVSEVFCILNQRGIFIDNCADTDLFNCKVQSGSDEAYYIAGGAGAFDEGVRMIGCSTNGQGRGVLIANQDWFIAEGCSFTTCPNGAVAYVQNSDNFKFTGCDFAAAGANPNSHGIVIDSNCNNFIISNNDFALNVFGVLCYGSKGIISGNLFRANGNVDIYLNPSTNISIQGNNCDSTTSGFSILEIAGSNYNSIVGNVTNGFVTTVGANSVSANNVMY